jgi:hypothetical protein
MAIDKVKVDEVIQFAENDYDSYDKLMKVYLPNLEKRVKSGKYDKTKAYKLLEYYYSNYVRGYMKMPRKYGYDPKLNPAERLYFSKYFVNYLEDEYLKKYRRKIARLKKSNVISKTKRKLK